MTQSALYREQLKDKNAFVKNDMETHCSNNKSKNKSMCPWCEINLTPVAMIRTNLLVVYTVMSYTKY